MFRTLKTRRDVVNFWVLSVAAICLLVSLLADSASGILICNPLDQPPMPPPVFIRDGGQATFYISGTIWLAGPLADTTYSAVHPCSHIQLPEDWSGVSLVDSAIQIYNETGDSIMYPGNKYEIVTWHQVTPNLTEGELAKYAKKGTTFWSFETDSAYSYSEIATHLRNDTVKVVFHRWFKITNAPIHPNSYVCWWGGDPIEGCFTHASCAVADGETPTLTQLGVVVLVALLIISAIYIMLRRRRAMVLA